METACAVVSCCSIPQITTESAKSASPSLDLRPNYHHETKKMVKNGDTAVQVLDKTDKVGVKRASRGPRWCHLEEDWEIVLYCIEHMSYYNFTWMKVK